MEDFRIRQRAFGQLRELYPSQIASALAAETQRAEPLDLNRIAELLQAGIVAGDSIILTPAAKHALQPRADLG